MSETQSERNHPVLSQSGAWDHYDRIVRMWHMQDILLPYLRGIFIGAESIIFAGAIFIGATGGLEILFYLSVVFGFVLSVMWRHVCFRQGMREGYFQWQILKLEDGQPPLAPTKIITELRTWLSHDGWKQLEQTNDPYWKSLTGGRLSLKRVRGVMDVYMPYGFSVLWVLLFVLHIYARYFSSK